MCIIERVLVKPTMDTSWEALKDQRKIPNGLYLFSKKGPPKVITHYLQDLENQGVDISDFSMDWLSEQPPNIMKRKKEPSENTTKSKTLKLGEPSATSTPTPMDSPISSKSHPSETHTLKLRQLSSSFPLHTSTYTPS